MSAVDAINIAANHQMFMTLTSELSWQHLRWSAVDFYSKKWKKSLFELPFRGLGGNVRTPPIARWKGRGQLYICRNWTLSLSYGWDVISWNLSKSAFLEGTVGHSGADFRGKGASPTNHCRCPSSRVIALSCGIKISAVHHLDLSQSTCVEDRQTHRQTTLTYARTVKNIQNRDMSSLSTLAAMGVAENCPLPPEIFGKSDPSSLKCSVDNCIVTFSDIGTAQSSCMVSLRLLSPC